MNRITTKIFVLLIILFSFALATGCETARYIRSAQNHFNQAAQVENQLLAKSLASYQAGANASSTTSALSDYQMALSLADKAIGENREKLRQEKLLGTAYMIKAMSLWRISDLSGTPPDPLEATSSESSRDNPIVSSPERQELIALIPEIERELADPQQPITLGTRDQVMLRALPGLLDHDRGRLANSMDRAEAFFSSSYKILGEAEGEAPSDHPVRIYIVMAQLQTLNAWTHAIDRLGREKDLSDLARAELLEEKIDPRVSKSLCSIKPLWENDEEVQKQLLKFLIYVGESWDDAVKQCK
jgi:hypothetical protein